MQTEANPMKTSQQIWPLKIYPNKIYPQDNSIMACDLCLSVH
jgi:hypothetical protein